jgi:hypothetical protein
MSTEKTPVLSLAVPAFEELIERWKKIADYIPHCAPLIEIGLLWADKYDERMGATNAYAVSMCQSGDLLKVFDFSHDFAVIDPAIRMSWVQEHWDEARCNAVKMHILELVRLIHQYHCSKFELIILYFSDACQESGIEAH